MQLDKNKILKLLLYHKWQSVSKFLIAIPTFVFFLCLRIVLFPMSILSAGILYISEKRKGVGLLTPVALFFTAVDMFLSKPLTVSFYDIKRLPKNFQTKKLKHILSESQPFILFLRDFDPSDSNIFDYSPIIGTTINYSHRDKYLFTGIEMTELNYPIVAIANNKDPTPSNKDVQFLRVRDEDWRQVVKALMCASHFIIIAVPISGELGRLFQMHNIQEGIQVMNRYWKMHSNGFESSPGLAIEVEEILKDKNFYEKSIFVNAFIDGSPYVTSTWFHIKSFQSLDYKDIKMVINETAVNI